MSVGARDMSTILTTSCFELQQLSPVDVTVVVATINTLLFFRADLKWG